MARVIGLAPGQEFEFTDKTLYQPFEDITVEEALKLAYASRSDYQAAVNDLRAAEYSRKAAVAGYYPSLSFNADFGAGGSHPSTATEVFDVRGTLRSQSSRAAAFMAIFCRPTPDSTRAGNDWTISVRKLTLTCVPRS